MNANVKTRWLEALKSGKYKKGTGYLCIDDNYCCLGVLADIENLFDDVSSPEHKTVKGHHSLLPQEIAKNYGLVNRGSHNGFALQLELTVINDNTNTFDEVIEYIERNL